MKKKLDFVTNSSSVSFCVWGQCFDYSFEKLSEKTKKIIYDMYAEEGKDRKDEIVTYEEYVDDAESFGWKEYFENLLEDNGFECSYGPYGEEFMFGISPTKMPEDMTLKGFKNDINNKLEELGISGGVYFIEEGWMDN